MNNNPWSASELAMANRQAIISKMTMNKGSKLNRADDVAYNGLYKSVDDISGTIGGLIQGLRG
jgi:hypothetical protein